MWFEAGAQSRLKAAEVKLVSDWRRLVVLADKVAIRRIDEIRFIYDMWEFVLVRLAYSTTQPKACQSDWGVLWGFDSLTLATCLTALREFELKLSIRWILLNLPANLSTPLWYWGLCWFGNNLVDPASSHMLVSKIKPCMSQYKSSHGETANGSLKQL